MRPKDITRHIGTEPFTQLFAVVEKQSATLSKSMFHIRWSSEWCANFFLLCHSENRP